MCSRVSAVATLAENGDSDDGECPVEAGISISIQHADVAVRTGGCHALPTGCAYQNEPCSVFRVSFPAFGIIPDDLVHGIVFATVDFLIDLMHRLEGIATLTTSKG